MKFYIFKQKHFQKMNEDTKKSKSGYFCFKCNKYLSEKRIQFKLHMESECKNKMFNLFGHVAKSILQEFVNNSDDNILSIFSKTLFNNKIDELNGNNNNDTDDNVITFGDNGVPKSINSARDFLISFVYSFFGFLYIVEIKRHMG